MPMTIGFIKKTLRYKKEYDIWQIEHNATAPKVDEKAPDFELLDVTGEHRISLSDFHGVRPVALVFGSFT
jgi:hypothetical protein